MRSPFKHIVLLAIIAWTWTTGLASPINASDITAAQSFFRYTDLHWFGSFYGGRANLELVSTSCQGDTSSCWDYLPQWIKVDVGSSQSGHRIVRLQSYSTGQCVSSSSGVAGDTAWQAPCSNDNEKWEVFPVGPSGNQWQVFKSWGAWQYQRLHLCLQANGNPAYVRLEVCDVNNKRQWWEEF